MGSAMGEEESHAAARWNEARWDEEQTGFLSRPQQSKTARATTGRGRYGKHRWARLVDRVDRVNPHRLLGLGRRGGRSCRRLDLARRLALAALALACVSLLVFEVLHHELHRLAPFRGSPFFAAPRPGYCTTWAGRSGNSTAQRLAPAKPGVVRAGFAPRESGWVKLAGVKVVALVMYAGRRPADLLDCYLRRNLVAQGGFLDEVRFIVPEAGTGGGGKEEQADVEYLRALVSGREGHYSVVEGGEGAGIWDSATEDDTIYVKIDGDIVFIHTDAIPQLVHTRIASPHPFAVAANVVNDALTASEHLHYGAVHAFRPDPDTQPPPPPPSSSETWRPSAVGRLFPPSRMPPRLNVSDVRGMTAAKSLLDDEITPQPPYAGHPFLLVSGGGDGVDQAADLMRTPAGLAHLRSGNAGGVDAARDSWAVAAQHHWSLLKNLEDDAVDRYFFGAPLDYFPPRPSDGSPSAARVAELASAAAREGWPGAEQLFDTVYDKHEGDLVAAWGHDVRAALSGSEHKADNNRKENKEQNQMTIAAASRRARRPVVVDTRAVAARFASSGPQRDGLARTDLLDRWRAFANEVVCAPVDRKVPFDARCPGF
ncbi:hypothetical protein GGR52DRAFT_562561 [Hypoxylon sp. FL1284]|nr:hypothetical protein GGR52DRAFT_562561 [Hypoxylon sp. FL1284]